MVFSQLVQLSIFVETLTWQKTSMRGKYYIWDCSPFNGNIWWFFRALNYWFLGHQSVTRYQYTQTVMTFVIRQLKHNPVTLSAGIQESVIMLRYKPWWMLRSHKWHVVQTFWSVKCDTNNFLVWPQDVTDGILVTMAWHHASWGNIRSQVWQHFDNSAGINGEIIGQAREQWRVQYDHHQSWQVYQQGK